MPGHEVIKGIKRGCANIHSERGGGEKVDKLESVIAYLVANFPRYLSRVELVKLVYFVELEFYKLYGKSLTGVTFYRYKYGPYSSTILTSIEKLAAAGVLEVRKTATCYGSPKYQHVLVHKPHQLELTDEERDVIDYVIEMNKGLTTTAIKDKSYMTAPMNKILETERGLKYISLWEELDMSSVRPERKKRSLKRIKKAFAKVDLSERGSVEDYNRVVAEERNSLKPFLNRALEVEK